jgi:hypothetical protein
MNISTTDFQIELENYQTGLQTILPSYLNGTYTDDAFLDELALVLQSRDWLESALAAAPRLAHEHLVTIELLDRDLLTIKDQLLEKASSFYQTFRQQAPRPRSHWWYYLDTIIAQFNSPSKQIEFWLPLTAA